MPHSRLTRTLRGSVAATVATFVALVSHVAGGGHVPGTLGILVPLLLSVFVCVLLSGRRLSLWRLSVSVVLSQLLFHGLFVLGTSGSTVVSTGAGAHNHAVDIVMSPSTMNHEGADGVSMWVAHVVAALITIAALHRGESVITALLGFTGHVVARIERAFSSALVAVVRPSDTGSAGWFEYRPTPLGVFASVSLQRGPPVRLGS